jgi:hypothetical protein
MHVVISHVTRNRDAAAAAAATVAALYRSLVDELI